jgi:hypothetical protein
VLWFRRRAWFLISIALGIAAIAFDCAGKKAAGNAAVGTARALQARHEGAPPEVVQSMKERAAARVPLAEALFIIGLLAAVASVVSLTVAGAKGEPGRHSVPIVILIA